MHAVDEAHERRVDAVAQQALRHDHGPRAARLPGRRHAIAPQVAAGDHHGGAVVLREVVDRPDRRRAERAARSRPGVEAVVVVQRLRRLAGQDVDRLELRQQVVGLEDAIEEPEDERVLDQRVAREGLLDHPVETPGGEGLEVVASRRVREARRDVGPDLLDFGVGQKPFDHGEAVALDARQQRVEPCRVDRGLRPGGRAVGAGEVRLAVVANVLDDDLLHDASFRLASPDDRSWRPLRQ